MRNLECLELFRDIEDLIIRGSRISALDALPRFKKLTTLCIDTPRSNSRSLAVLAALSLDALIVRITTENDVRDIGSCGYIRHVELVGYPEHDLESLQALQCRVFCIGGGNLVNVSGFSWPCPYLRFAQCKKLLSVADAETEYLSIQGCRRLDFDTVSHVKGLRFVQVMDQKMLSSLSFASPMLELRQMEITASSVAKRALDSFVSPPNLERLWISPCKEKQSLKHISKRSPDLGVANGGWCFVGGEELSLNHYHKDWNFDIRQVTGRED